MDELDNYYDNAELSAAAYAVLLPGYTNIEMEQALKSEQGNSYSETQGKEFSKRYSVIDSQQNTDTGFSATLFQSESGVYTLAIRGTEFGLDLDTFDDLVLTDIADIGADGIALKQAVDLFNYYQKLITPTNKQATVVGVRP